MRPFGIGDEHNLQTDPFYRRTPCETPASFRLAAHTTPKRDGNAMSIYMVIPHMVQDVYMYQSIHQSIKQAIERSVSRYLSRESLGPAAS